jgi:hypothetical protein
MTDEKKRELPLLKIKVGDKVKEVTYEELSLSNNLATEALVSLLIEKGVIKPDEFMKKMQDVSKDRYKKESEL